MEGSNEESTQPFESHTNMFPLPINFLQGLMMNIPVMDVGSLEERVTNQSFHEQQKYKQVSSKDFINSLSVQKVSEELVDKKITCGVCLEELTLGEDIIELPCPNKHYFHIKKEECPGIYPWLKENNSCPMCRHEFPSEEVEKKNTPPTTPRPRRRNNPLIITPNLLQNMFNSVMEEEEERMLQEVLYNSLNK